MYNNSPQVKIVSLRLTDASKGEPTSASHFVEHAPMTKEEMEEEVNQIMFDITNPYLRRIVHNILKNTKKTSSNFLQRNVTTMRL